MQYCINAPLHAGYWRQWGSLVCWWDWELQASLCKTLGWKAAVLLYQLHRRRVLLWAGQRGWQTCHGIQLLSAHTSGCAVTDWHSLTSMIAITVWIYTYLIYYYTTMCKLIHCMITLVTMSVRGLYYGIFRTVYLVLWPVVYSSLRPINFVSAWC